MARPTPPPQHPQIRNHAPIPRRDDQEGKPMTDEWMRHPVTGLTAPHHATQTDEQAQEAHVDVQDTQKAREKRWAEAAVSASWDTGASERAKRRTSERNAQLNRNILEQIARPGRLESVGHALMAMADEEVLAAITVARQDMAQCVAERDQARAEVERLTGSLEIALRHLTERGHPEDVARYARLHIEAALAGRSRPLILEQRRAEAAEAREVALRERIEALAVWFESQPNWVDWGVHRQLRAALAAEPTPPAAPHAEDRACGACGEAGCDYLCAPVADPSGTGETR